MTDALTDRLRAAASAGYDEWRVQNPKDGAFCIAYSWPDTMSPEREARAWLADHKARFPDSPKAGYVVACVRVVPLKDRLLAEAAAEIDRLRAADEAHRAAFAAIYTALQPADPDRATWPAEIERLRAAIAAPGVPPGWQLVPVEPTPEMVHAVTRAESRHMLEDRKRGGFDPHLGWSAAYRAMLAAAPTAQQEPKP